MGRVYHPYYTAEIPADAVIATAPDGTRTTTIIRRGKPVTVEVIATKNGDRLKIVSPNLAIEWIDENGKVRHEKAGKNPRSAKQMLANRELKVERLRSGVVTAQELRSQEPLLTQLTDYLAVIAAKGACADYCVTVKNRVTAVISECRWNSFDDVNADTFVCWVAGIQSRGQPISPSTRNGYLRYVRGFTRWVAERGGRSDPLRKIPRWKEEHDLRRSRAILTDSQFDQLLAVAAATKARRVGEFAGEPRAVLYLVAAYTGFRVSELAVLRPCDFHLDDPTPIVVLPAKHTKNKREVRQPIPAAIVPRLRDWLADLDPHKTAWPARADWSRRALRCLRSDLKRAGIPRLDSQGKPLNFHGLRRKYVTAVVESGASIKDAMTLARHSDPKLTLQVYAQSKGITDLGKVVDRLPGPGEGN